MKKRILSLLLVLCILSLLVGSVSALESEPQLPCVTDMAGLLEESQAQRLEQMAQTVAKQYGVGVYIVTVEDYRQVDPAGVYEATYGIYHAYTMGEGKYREGIMLLSMEDRDYALFCYGKQTAYAFDDYGLKQLEKKFLDDFADNNWYDGFEDYIRTCAQYLQQAAAGKPVRKSPVTLLLITWGLALLIATAVCITLVAQMKTVRKSTSAARYAGSLSLTEQYDQFTHRTETRRRIERSGSGGSHSESGGGGYGTSGKF